jgi:citrate synthase
VVLLARCAGLLGQVAEEIRRPIANDIYLAVDRNARYVPPHAPDTLDAPQASATPQAPAASETPATPDG